MRLKTEEAQFIKKTAQDCFGEGARVYLFGSRTNDYKKGGDIDLYIETQVKEHLFDKKINMLGKLYNKLGEQKIDIVINNFTSSLYIYDIAKSEGVLL